MTRQLQQPYVAKVVFIVVVVFTVTSTLSIALRFVGKRIKKLSLSAEDVLIIAALIALYGLASTILTGILIGALGHHAYEIPTKVPTLLKIALAVQCLYALSLSLVKISICLFYNRIFPFRHFRMASWTVIAAIIVWMTYIVLYALLICRPLSLFWDVGPGSTPCGDYIASWIASGVADVLIDVAMIILPQPLLWKLKVSLADRIALTMIFGVGVVTTIISVVRVHALSNTDFADITYSSHLSVLWSFVEPAMGISVACAPFFRPIVKQVSQTMSTRDQKECSSSGSGSRPVLAASVGSNV